MATNLDYLPNTTKPRAEWKFDLHSPEGIALVALGVIFFAWAFISFILVIENGGNFFDEKNGCTSSYQVIMKYSPPFWGTLTRWLFPSMLLAMLVLLFGGSIWHTQSAP
jgi:hypothetical protein